MGACSSLWYQKNKNASENTQLLLRDAISKNDLTNRTYTEEELRSLAIKDVPRFSEVAKGFEVQSKEQDHIIQEILRKQQSIVEDNRKKQQDRPPKVNVNAQQPQQRAQHAPKAAVVANPPPPRKKKKKSHQTEEDNKILQDPKQLYSIYFKPLLADEPLPDLLLQVIQENFPERDMAEFRAKMRLYLRGATKLAVKLIFVSNLLPVPSVASKFATKQPYGSAHVGVLIGPWFFHWTPNERVYPKPIPRKRKGDIIAVLDLHYGLPLQKKPLTQLCKMLATWNEEMHFAMFQYSYAKIRDEGCKESNCQAFVQALLATIKAPAPWWEPDGPIAEFMRAMKTNCQAIRPNYQGKEFKTHKQLDSFIFEKWGGQQPTEKKDLEEFEILRAFDFRFWCNSEAGTRKERDRGREKNAALNQEEEKEKTEKNRNTNSEEFQENPECPFASDPTARFRAGGEDEEDEEENMDHGWEDFLGEEFWSA